ncbi:hypothetical protein Esti_004341 [Eimeria stiedai]
MLGKQSASYAAAFPALSEVYSLTTAAYPEEEGPSRLGGSSTRSSSGSRGGGYRAGSSLATRTGETGLFPCTAGAAGVAVRGDTVEASEPYPLSRRSDELHKSFAEEQQLRRAPRAQQECPLHENVYACGLRRPTSLQGAVRSRSTSSTKPQLHAHQQQRRVPPSPPGKTIPRTTNPADLANKQLEFRRSPHSLRGALPPQPPRQPPPFEGFTRGTADAVQQHVQQQQQQQQHRAIGRHQRQQQHTFPPAAALRKAGAGAHHLQHLESLRGSHVGGGPPPFSSSSGAPRKNGGGGLLLRGPPPLSSPSESYGAPRACPPPLSSLCLQPLGDGCFRAVLRSHQRDGHRQRVAGVDVWRLADGCIVPRIEGAPLSAYLAERAEALEELEEALLSCVQFLYKEGIKPFAGEIAHQLRKRTNAGTWLPSEVVALAMASEHVYPKVERRVKGEDGWVILLKPHFEPEGFEGFVDTRAKENLYTQEQWLHFNKYFIDKLRQGSLSPSCFTEGRYALAERMREEVPAFSKTRLAHLIRMIQLASWNRVLTYRDKALIPVAACPAAAREFIQRHCTDPKGEKAAATAAAVAHLLKVMRKIVNPEPLGIFLAQLKDLVRWTTHERLDAGVYGHPKLQDLLLSDPFSRFYRLYTPEGNDHCTYVQSKQYLLPKGAVLHRKASVAWRSRECPMGGSDTPLADSRVWQFKALVPIGGAADRDAPLFEVWDSDKQQQHQQHHYQQQQQQQQHLSRAWTEPMGGCLHQEHDIDEPHHTFAQQQAASFNRPHGQQLLQHERLHRDSTSGQPAGLHQQSGEQQPLLQMQQAAADSSSIEQQQISGIEVALLRLVEESPSNPCGLITHQTLPASALSPAATAAAPAAAAIEGERSSEEETSSEHSIGLAFALKRMQEEGKKSAEEENPDNNISPLTQPESQDQNSQEACELQQQQQQHQHQQQGRTAAAAAAAAAGDAAVPQRESSEPEPPLLPLQEQQQEQAGSSRATSEKEREEEQNDKVVGCSSLLPFDQSKELNGAAAVDTPDTLQEAQQQHEQQDQQRQQQQFDLQHQQHGDVAQEEEQQQQHQAAGLQFLWHHPAAFISSSAQNTPSADLLFLPLCCEARSNGWRVGRKFRGVRCIDRGCHFLHWTERPETQTSAETPQEAECTYTRMRVDEAIGSTGQRGEFIFFEEKQIVWHALTSNISKQCVRRVEPIGRCLEAEGVPLTVREQELINSSSNNNSSREEGSKRTGKRSQRVSSKRGDVEEEGTEEEEALPAHEEDEAAREKTDNAEAAACKMFYLEVKPARAAAVSAAREAAANARRSGSDAGAAAAAAVTRQCTDRSDALMQLAVEQEEGWSAILGELEVAFIALVLGHHYPSFVHWKDLVELLSSSEKAVYLFPDIFAKFLDAFYAQLEQAPDEMTQGALQEENFLSSSCAALLETCYRIDREAAFRELKNTKQNAHTNKELNRTNTKTAHPQQAAAIAAVAAATAACPAPFTPSEDTADAEADVRKRLQEMEVKYRSVEEAAGRLFDLVKVLFIGVAGRNENKETFSISPLDEVLLALQGADAPVIVDAEEVEAVLASAPNRRCSPLTDQDAMQTE